jgi:hypothetical protein
MPSVFSGTISDRPVTPFLTAVFFLLKEIRKLERDGVYKICLVSTRMPTVLGLNTISKIVGVITPITDRGAVDNSEARAGVAGTLLEDIWYDEIASCTGNFFLLQIFSKLILQQVSLQF